MRESWRWTVYPRWLEVFTSEWGLIIFVQKGGWSFELMIFYWKINVVFWALFFLRTRGEFLYFFVLFMNHVYWKTWRLKSNTSLLWGWLLGWKRCVGSLGVSLSELREKIMSLWLFFNLYSFCDSRRESDCEWLFFFF